jgi:N-methylhydantoinase A/oxoprolinase/acetone carboxylase beta subunit
MHNYIIGIDTGGTFTDAVLMETQSGRIIAAAKKPTTHYHLAESTGAALAALLQGEAAIPPAEIGAVAVSSTLATNSVVENKGARVALFVIGYVKHFKLPVKAVIFVKGGHTIMGTEEEPLELEYLVSLIHGLRDEVDAYGVCAAMSMVNPTHELVTEKAIAMIDPKPVFCSHRVSQTAGMQERAATAGLHAKLMPIMQEYITGVEEAMTTLGLSCPMVIISGSAGTISSDQAVELAGMTVASGPACTACFGAEQTAGSALIIDVGGTTTDIAMIQDGRALMATEGCTIGGWRTHVEAIDMSTGGIGGDSHVSMNDKGHITIGPNRVVPLAMAADLPPIEGWFGKEERNRLIVFRPESKTTGDDKLTTFLRTQGRATPEQIRRATGLSGVTLGRDLEQLERLQQTWECGFTPTDALHVLHRIDLGNRARALAGAAVLAREIGTTAEAFCEMVIRRTEEQIENLVIDHLVRHYWGNSLTSFIAGRNDHPVLGVDFSLKIPLIGIGAAARYFLPAIASRLATTVLFPQYCEVGNAVGAALICKQTLADQHQPPAV